MSSDIRTFLYRQSHLGVIDVPAYIVTSTMYKPRVTSPWLSTHLNLIRLYTFLLVAGPLILIHLFCSNVWLKAFWTIFTLRYARLFGHLFSYYFCYTPSPMAAHPRYTSRDVTVILPTIDPAGPDFEECLSSILANKPRAVLIVTVGKPLLQQCFDVATDLGKQFPDTNISVSELPVASKRRQIAHAMPHVQTAITVLADDHVFWPSLSFLTSALAPFENDRVAAVSTRKRVRRTEPGVWSWPSLVNFTACNYLERHNWELRASSGIDGGLFVISGRTALYCTEFLKDPFLLSRFCNESFFFGLLGGELGPDDDNFLTREATKSGWLVRFQDTADATVETTLGEWPKFKGQLVRWARTTFRSNPVMLRDGNFLGRYPWSCGMVYLAGVTNFALL